MLRSHFSAIENTLLANYQVTAGAGHSVHKGTPREVLVRDFLAGHLAEAVSIGTGEIIDAKSRPNKRRNQHDIVIYRKTYPKLVFGGGINAYLAEAVVATIEVKSTLTSEELRTSIIAARNAKQLERNLVTSFSAGYQPPAILNYVVAYNGPSTMRTVALWLESIHGKEGIAFPTLPLDQTQRQRTPSPSVDGVLVLGKGFLYFDNFPLSFVRQEERQNHPNLRWVSADSPGDALFSFFLFLTTAISGINGSWLNPLPYVAQEEFTGISFGPT